MVKLTKLFDTQPRARRNAERSLSAMRARRTQTVEADRAVADAAVSTDEPTRS